MRLKPVISLLIAIVLYVGIGVGAYFLLIGSRRAKVNEVKKQVEETERLISTEKSTYDQLMGIKAQSAEYEARLGELQAKIPAQPDLPGLIRQIQAAADPGMGAGLPWVAFSPSEVEKSESQGISMYTFDMTVAGFYDEVVELIYRIERFSRAVIMNSITMQPTEKILEIEYSPNLGLVNVDINATTFTFFVTEEIIEEEQKQQQQKKPSEEEELEEEQSQ